MRYSNGLSKGRANKTDNRMFESSTSSNNSRDGSLGLVKGTAKSKGYAWKD